MNGRVEDSSVHSRSGASEASRTLRIIADLPAPRGLEERIHSALSNAPHRPSVLAWPSGATFRRSWTQSGLVRGAAAAAIVFVVAGGGWGVYSRVQPIRPPKVITMPAVAPPGGFSTGSAIRTPLTGPVLKHPIAALPKKGDTQAAARKQGGKKAGRVGKKSIQKR